MDKSLAYTEHIENTVKKASSTITILSRTRPNFTPHVSKAMYKAMYIIYLSLLSRYVPHGAWE